MKAKEIRDMTIEEAEAKLKDVTIELFNFRFQHANNQLESPMKIPQRKKDIAKLNTIIKEKRLSEQAHI
ncbi:MAG: 50S ribosomal protein L29 [Pseudomonadota bacterium]